MCALCVVTARVALSCSPHTGNGKIIPFALIWHRSVDLRNASLAIPRGIEKTNAPSRFAFPPWELWYAGVEVLLISWAEFRCWENGRNETIGYDSFLSGNLFCILSLYEGYRTRYCNFNSALQGTLLLKPYLYIFKASAHCIVTLFLHFEASSQFLITRHLSTP